MKRKQLHQSNHPFNPQPFEAFWSGSWHPVEQLSICDGSIITHIVNDGEVIELEDFPMQTLRVRSREATWSDCVSFLRPGIDICVLSDTHPSSEEEEEDQKNKFVWLDARIRSIERKAHGCACTCRFYVSSYITQGPDLFSENKKLSKQTSTVSIHQIAVIQNLEPKPSETQYYRWGSTEDCFSVSQYRSLLGKFSSDLMWLLAASVHKKTAFDVVSIHNRIVYEISESNPRPRRHSNAVSFKLDSKIVAPVVVRFFPGNLPEGSGEQEYGIAGYDLTGLRRSKRRHVQPERFLAGDNLPDYEIEVTRIGGNKMYKADGESRIEHDEDESEQMSVQADEYDENSGSEIRSCSHDRKMSKKPQQTKTRIDCGFKIPKEEPEEDIDEMFSEYMKNGPSSLNKKAQFDCDFNFTDLDCGGGSGIKGPGKKYAKKSCWSSTVRKNACFYVREGVHDGKSFSKSPKSAGLCREMIRRCMINIDETLKNTLKQVPLVERWKDIQTDAEKAEEVDKDEEKPAEESREEISEVDMLWREMELAMASWYLLDDNEDHVQPKADVQNSSRNACKHNYILDEQVGTVCYLCGFVETEIRDIFPPFVSSSQWTSNKDKKTGEVSDHKTDEDASINQYSIPPPSSAPSIDVGKHANVWDLIPDLGSKLRPHQRKAFKFLWRNIAGSMKPSRMEKRKKRRGGCVISHTPGAGKTLLIIAFLTSYLKLFPESRPLVLAPKTTLYTWHKEIAKWNISDPPVYQIHGLRTYRGEVLQQRGKIDPSLPKNHNVLHVLDSLDKMQKWLSHPSILLMGYPSFLTLTREDSNYAHRKYMAQLLKRCPGILILDEGHNPRSTKSRLRKGLMKVETRLRILLSGTLFQNNFGEYFNTLCLARPSFVDEVLRELDPRYEKRSRDGKTRSALENRGRKFLIEKIAKKIESYVAEERTQALTTLKKLTWKFIDVYEGGDSDNLPGLQCYTLMMKLTSLQQEVMSKLQNRGFALELEFLITLAAIHPCLIKTTACSGNYLTKSELEDLEKFEFDVKSGSKVRFVMELVPGCVFRNEKVLIFCHNIAPINLFAQMFERVYGWRKGREVLVLQGDMELFERGRVIDKFEEAGGPSKVMLASITACAEGISLTAASRVILIDSEWNPSRSKQAIARAFRPGQNRVVYVYQLLGAGTLEEETHGRTTWKEWVSDMIFSEESVEDDPARWEAPRIEDELLREMVEEDRGVMFHQIMKNEKAYNVVRGKGVVKNLA